MYQPLLSFGLVADVQYSDLEDGHSEGRTQRYREAPGKLKAAVDAWDAQGDVRCVINLGDTINGNSSDSGKNAAELEVVATVFDRLAVPVHHAIGNHCLSVEREHLRRRLGIPGSYYTVPLAPGWRLIVLDTTEMSGHSNLPPDSDAVQEAEAYMSAHPLGEDEPQMASWNGGITSSQLRWLDERLTEANVAGESVIVAAHHQAGRGAARPTHLAWNWKEIRAAMVASKCVKLYLSGHDHMGGYLLDSGVHWITVEAMLEAPTDGNAYAVVHIHRDRLEIQGVGVSSRTLYLA